MNSDDDYNEDYSEIADDNHEEQEEVEDMIEEEVGGGRNTNYSQKGQNVKVQPNSNGSNYPYKEFKFGEFKSPNQSSSKAENLKNNVNSNKKND